MLGPRPERGVGLVLFCQPRGGGSWSGVTGSTPLFFSGTFVMNSPFRLHNPRIEKPLSAITTSNATDKPALGEEVVVVAEPVSVVDEAEPASVITEAKGIADSAVKFDGKLPEELNSVYGSAPNVAVREMPAPKGSEPRSAVLFWVDDDQATSTAKVPRLGVQIKIAALLGGIGLLLSGCLAGLIRGPEPPLNA